jgi:hypothetical protein
MGFFYVIIIAVPYGYFAGGLILKASGMKRGMKLEIAAGAGMVVGALAFKLLPGLVAGKPLIVLGNTMLSVGPTSLLDPIFLVTVAIATGCAVSKIRYL